MSCELGCKTECKARQHGCVSAGRKPLTGAQQEAASNDLVRPASEAHQCVQAGGPKMCEYLKCTYEGMDGERYRCEVCGRSYFLDYGDMQ